MPVVKLIPLRACTCLWWVIQWCWTNSTEGRFTENWDVAMCFTRTSLKHWITSPVTVSLCFAYTSTVGHAHHDTKWSQHTSSCCQLMCRSLLYDYPETGTSSISRVHSQLLWQQPHWKAWVQVVQLCGRAAKLNSVSMKIQQKAINSTL